jgi:uncharacterized cupin superfamily protein
MSDADRGWFVVNARDAGWRGGNGRTPLCDFEDEHRFPQLGINLTVLEPGSLASLYHSEGAQEDFLVLAGACRLLIAGHERSVGQWDFIHCPAHTPHTFVADGAACLLLQVGARPVTRVTYPVADIARSYGVSAEYETCSVPEAYGARRRKPIPYGGWLDGEGELLT